MRRLKETCEKKPRSSASSLSSFPLHFRSALIAIVTLPFAVLISFIPMHLLGVSSNIMSLGGLALAVGVFVDAAIVMVENGYRRLSEYQKQHPGSVANDLRFQILIDAAKQVGPAWTKTLAVASSSILAITLVPVLMTLLIRGRLRPERANPVSRFTQALYLPVLRFCLHHRVLAIVLNLAFLIVTLPLALHLGSQFMPPLFEGSALYMPTALPGIAIGQATALLGEQDRILRSFPEVESVFGSVGRSDSATGNAPLDMYDTLTQEMDAKLQFPGLSNTWTMPVENRLDMELTGIKTPLRIKVQGPNVEGIERAASEIQAALSGLPQLRSIFSERVAQGFYINVEPNRAEAARYGLTIEDVQGAVTSGIGGQNIAENIEGRERTRLMCGMSAASAMRPNACSAF